MDKLKAYFKKIFLPECTHKSAKRKNCSYCPDCGKKVACKWIVIECKGCAHFRKPSIDRLGNIKPLKKYCFHCGSDKWGVQNYYESIIPDSLKTIAFKHVETQNPPQFGSLTGKTKVWVSYPGFKN